MGKIALLSLSMLLFGALTQAAAADEHGQSEHPQSKGPGPVNRPAPVYGHAQAPAYDAHGQALDARYNHGPITRRSGR